MMLRTGRRNGRNLYLQLGEQPGDDDPCVGMLDTEGLAQLLVRTGNDALRAEGPAALELIMGQRLSDALDGVAAVKQARHG